MPDYYEGRVSRGDYFKFILVFVAFGIGFWIIAGTMNKFEKENSAYVDELTNVAREENVLRIK